ncbi:drug/metabolite transporter (DMT)-like permease [Azospirillum fermentarium]|uniref:DMT family transporter n=1 Tax=Azospirillum fermentarium TaxID=1233114 RepID=UPI0022266889|nr:DMT family transporter [Azospirillum fermentarium]MCW2245885.1 drug/metabolite transporter (DMT)-like permease [Azospirillum fermentarium]
MQNSASSPTDTAAAPSLMLARAAGLTALAMMAFAANSILCRLALKGTGIDAASFTTLRILSGAVVLGLLAWRAGGQTRVGGSWASGLALLAYAAAFSFAYITLPAGSGALLLFGAVQVTMIVSGLVGGERPGMMQAAGLALAAAGLVALVLPGVSAPPLLGSALMIAAGIAWGVYSLRGRKSREPALIATAGNFIRAVPMALAVLAAALLVDAGGVRVDGPGVVYALLSGAVASGMGYALWYATLPLLTATRAASVQLSVPVITALAGVPLLGEPLSLRLVLASVAVLGGIALVITGPRRA